MTKKYYKILGISETAPFEEIKKAYRELALKWHPDKQVGKSSKEKVEANEKMQELNKAYEILSDDNKRKNYDLGVDSPSDAGYQYDYEAELRREQEELREKLRRNEIDIIELEREKIRLELKALDRSSTLNEIGADLCFSFPRVYAEDLVENGYSHL